MSKTQDLASGKIGPETILGSGITDEVYSKFTDDITRLVTDAEIPFAYKGADIAIAQVAQIIAVNNFVENDVEDTELLREGYPAVFCQQEDFDDGGINLGYVIGAQILAKHVDELEAGVFALSHKPLTAIKAPAGVIIGQLLDLSDPISMGHAMPGVKRRIDYLKETHPNFMPYDAHFVAAYTPCRFDGNDTFLINEARANDELRTAKLASNPPAYTPIVVKPI